ncbi:MAG: hypothetical protein ABJA66_05235 [Actinomycetota bacterium]
MTQVIKPWWRNVPAPQFNQILTFGGEIYYAPGKWGEKLHVGDNFTIEAIRRDIKFKLKPFVLTTVETNINGEFILTLITLYFHVSLHKIFLQVTEKETLKRAVFDLGQLVNLQLTTQTQLIPPLVVHWGPN